MKRITIWLMKRHLKEAKAYRDSLDTPIVIRAYDRAIKNYEDTIMFLRAEVNSKSK